MTEHQTKPIKNPAETGNFEEDTDCERQTVDEQTDNLTNSENEETLAILDIDYPSENENTAEILLEATEEPDSSSIMPNFTRVLEDRISAYRRRNDPSETAKIGSVTLSDKEVNKVLRRSKVKCVAIYNKKRNDTKRLQSHIHSLQKAKRRGAPGSRVLVLVGEPAVIKDLKAESSYQQERGNSTGYEKTAKKVNSNVIPQSEIEGAEKDACTYYDAVGQLHIKVSGSEIIEYSWSSDQTQTSKTCLTESVAVKHFPDVQEDVIEQSHITGLLHFTSFVHCTVQDSGKNH